jgi:hypothetical protein
MCGQPFFFIVIRRNSDQASSSLFEASFAGDDAVFVAVAEVDHQTDRQPSHR